MSHSCSPAANHSSSLLETSLQVSAASPLLQKGFEIAQPEEMVFRLALFRGYPDMDETGLISSLGE